MQHHQTSSNYPAACSSIVVAILPPTIVAWTVDLPGLCWAENAPPTESGAVVGQPSASNGTPEPPGARSLSVQPWVFPMAWFWIKVASKRVMKNRRHPVIVRRRAKFLRRILIALSKSKKPKGSPKAGDKKKDDDNHEHDDEIGRWMMSMAALRPRKT